MIFCGLTLNRLRLDWQGMASYLKISENAAVEDHMSKLFEILVKHYKYKTVKELRNSFENIDLLKLLILTSEESTKTVGKVEKLKFIRYLEPYKCQIFFKSNAKIR